MPETWVWLSLTNILCRLGASPRLPALRLPTNSKRTRTTFLSALAQSPMALYLLAPQSTAHTAIPKTTSNEWRISNGFPTGNISETKTYDSYARPARASPMTKNSKNLIAPKPYPLSHFRLDTQLSFPYTPYHYQKKRISINYQHQLRFCGGLGPSGVWLKYCGIAGKPG